MRMILKRNLAIYFRDKGAVFFSLLTVFIIIALYALFLGDTMKRGIEGEGVDFLMDSWVIAGILGVISTTSTLGAFGVMVEDRAKKIGKDFMASPLSRNAIAGGYMLSAVCVGVIMSLVAFLAGEIYIYVSGGELLGGTQVLKILGGILLSTLSGSALVAFVVSFIKSQNSYATLSIIVGTLIGFLAGVYIPIGELPEGVQTAIKFFPPSYAASYFRNILLEEPMEITFENAPASVITEFEHEMGVNFVFGDKETTVVTCVIVMLCLAVIFYFLFMANIARKRKTY